MRPIAASVTGLLLVATVSMAAPPSASAGVIEIPVTTTADVIADDGACSLREAVIAANTNTAVDTCPAGTGTDFDNINLPAGTYVLTLAGTVEDAAATGDLDLLEEVGIDGPFDGSGPAVIDGGGIDRVFDVHPSAGRVFFRRVTIANGAIAGEDGGAIRVASSGGLDEDGGCIANLTADLFEAVVRDSVADRGGGIFVGQCARVSPEWSSIVDNAATGNGGGVAVEGALASAGFVTSTVSGNVAGGIGGGLWAGGAVTDGLFNTTMAHNQASQGGGIALEGSSFQTFAVGNSILAHNGGGDCWLETGEEAAFRYSLDTDGTCGDGPGVLHGADPMLLSRDADPVAYRLAAGSPAIDAGDPNFDCSFVGLSNDQYHNQRPLDGDGDGEAICDMGSYEAPAVPVQPSPSPPGSPAPSDPGSGVTLPDTASVPGEAQAAPPELHGFALGIGLILAALIASGARRLAPMRSTARARHRSIRGRRG